jgi:hypothetical protein
MIKSEKHLQDYVIREANLRGIYCRKVVAVGHTGFPDLFLAHKGRVVMVELKSPTGKGRLSAKQNLEIVRLTRAGLDVRVIDSYEGADDVITTLTKAHA